MVEQWSPKLQVKGSNPSSPDPTLWRPLFFIPLGGVRNQRIGPDPFFCYGGSPTLQLELNSYFFYITDHIFRGRPKSKTKERPWHSSLPVSLSNH